MNNQDAISRLAMARMVKDSAELEVQLDNDARLHPVVTMLAMARDQACSAVHQLIFADPAATELVRSLQNEIRRYDDLVQFCKQIFVAGKEADRKLSADERDELADIILSPDVADEIRALGGIAQEFDA